MTDSALVWLVVYGNYYPPEVLAIYDNEDAARDHADAEQEESPLPLEVIPWTLHSAYLPASDPLKEAR